MEFVNGGVNENCHPMVIVLVTRGCNALLRHSERTEYILIIFSFYGMICFII